MVSSNIVAMVQLYCWSILFAVVQLVFTVTVSAVTNDQKEMITIYSGAKMMMEMVNVVGFVKFDVWNLNENWKQKTYQCIQSCHFRKNLSLQWLNKLHRTKKENESSRQQTQSTLKRCALRSLVSSKNYDRQLQQLCAESMEENLIRTVY